MIQPPMDLCISPLSKGALRSCSWLACIGWCTCWCAVQSSEPVWLALMCRACVPGQPAAALPKSNKKQLLALIAPHSGVQVMAVEGSLGPWGFVWASWASEVNDARWWWYARWRYGWACMCMSHGRCLGRGSSDRGSGATRIPVSVLSCCWWLLCWLWQVLALVGTQWHEVLHRGQTGLVDGGWCGVDGSLVWLKGARPSCSSFELELPDRQLRLLIQGLGGLGVGESVLRSHDLLGELGLHRQCKAWLPWQGGKVRSYAKAA